MQTFILALYVLIWPLISLAVLGVIGVATVKDIRVARRDKRELV
nr:putative transporter small subunit [Halomonas sp.]